MTTTNNFWKTFGNRGQLKGKQWWQSPWWVWHSQCWSPMESHSAHAWGVCSRDPGMKQNIVPSEGLYIPGGFPFRLYAWFMLVCFFSCNYSHLSGHAECNCSVLWDETQRCQSLNPCFLPWLIAGLPWNADLFLWKSGFVGDKTYNRTCAFHFFRMNRSLVLGFFSYLALGWLVSKGEKTH